MADSDRQMPSHVEVAYQDTVNNITFLRRQQWIATNYALLVYAALFVVSAEYFSRTDFARNWLGIIAIATFFIHFYMVYLFQSAMDSSRDRLDWIYRTYFKNRLAWICSGHDHLGMNGKFPSVLSLSRSLASS
jgi:hypothetical protein